MQSSRLEKRSLNQTDPQSHTPYHILSSDEMKARMAKLHSELRRIQNQRDRVKERLDRVIERNGVTVSDEVEKDLKSIIENEGSKATESENCTYFQKIFWQQQVLASSKKDARGMKWHPLL